MTTHKEALKLALEALEKLTNAAEGFSVSGVYFNEELWARKCLDDAYDAMGFAQEALAQQSNEQVEPSHVWAKVEEYADSVHDFNEAVRIDVGIDEVGKKCLAIEKELKEMLAHSPVPTAQPKEPEQEPVAYGMWDTMIGCGGRMMYVRLDKGQDGCTVPLYTIPPQRKLLTDEQWMIEMVDAAMVATRDIVPRITRSQCRLIIEAAHGIKE